MENNTAEKFYQYYKSFLQDIMDNMSRMATLLKVILVMFIIQYRLDDKYNEITSRN